MEEKKENQKKNNIELKTVPKKKRFGCLFWICFGLILVILILWLTKLLVFEIKYKMGRIPSYDSRFDNIETEIYDMRKSLEEQAIDPAIADQDGLKAQLENLKNQKQNQRLLSKAILAFIELKQCLDSNKNKDCDDELQQLKITASFDVELAPKIEKMEIILHSDVKSSQEISAEFSALIPKIIAKKFTNLKIENKRFSNKLKSYFSTLITIRKTDRSLINSGDDVDLAIVRIEESLAEKNYQQTLNLINSLDEIYQPIFTKLIFDLQNFIELEIINQEIFYILKNKINKDV